MIPDPLPAVRPGRAVAAGCCALLLGLMALGPAGLRAQDLRHGEIPDVYRNLHYGQAGHLQFNGPDGAVYRNRPSRPPYTLPQMRRGISGTMDGLAFDFQDAALEGRLYYGFIHPTQGRYKQPVFFKHYAEVKNGKAEVDIRHELAGKYDMVDWQERGRAQLGYRLVREDGQFLYDGKVNIKGKGPFEVAATIAEGPFIQNVQPRKALVRFVTLEKIQASVEIDNTIFQESKPRRVHEIELLYLSPNTEYEYTIRYGDRQDTYSFRTALPHGSDSAFTFAYCSDSRAGQGGGERNIYGTNAYMMERLFALARQQDARFVQFTGDLVNGYLEDAGEMRLQYANWKRAVEPFCHEMPVYTGFGNHEALIHELKDERGRRASVDRFPFDTASAEAVFARSFANPENGPRSEDGARYDPDTSEQNFPPYSETAFHYQFGNVAMISLNSDYFYAPSTELIPHIGGNPHAYIMDQQMFWLKRVLDQYEADPEIDHIFVTQHTPAFPNGGHADDDMWYRGNNEIRPYVAGKPLEEGIIERRDRYLSLLVNQSDKVRAILTGDEHNYNRLRVDEAMARYPAGWDKPKLHLDRPIWQINNGAAGAPYYGQEDLPWSEDVVLFSTQNALVLFHVKGETLEMEVLNPVTLETIDTLSWQE
jgi:hypothetical protein